MLVILLAYPFGVLLAQLASTGIEYNMPVYLVVVLEPFGLLKVLFGVVIMMILGSLLPVRMIARTDPVLAFQVE